jgi:hypothetical protein
MSAECFGRRYLPNRTSCIIEQQSGTAQHASSLYVASILRSARSLRRSCDSSLAGKLSATNQRH